MLLFLAGCRQNDEVDNKLNMADRIMEEDQDDTSVSISILNTIIKSKAKLSKSQTMRLHLLQAKANNNADIRFKSDSLMKEVVRYYEENGTDEELMESYYLLGCVYRDLNDAPMAIQYLNEADEYAGDDLRSYNIRHRIHSQIAALLEGQNLSKQELDELQLASHYALLAKDTVKAITYYNLKASAFKAIGKPDSAFIVNDSAINIFKRMGRYKQAAQISAEGVQYLLDKKRYNEAKRRLDFYEKESGLFSNGKIQKGKESYYYIKGLYHLNTNQTDSAEYYFRKCLDYKDNSNMAIAGFRGLCLLYQARNNSDSVAKYALLAYKTNDSIYQRHVGETVLVEQSLYSYDKYKEIAKQNDTLIFALKSCVLYLIAILIAIISIVINAYKAKRKKNILQQNLTQEKYEAEKNLLKQEVGTLKGLLDERQCLLKSKDELFEKKNKELCENIENKEKYIGELHERIADYERELNIKDIASTEDEIQNSALKRRFEYYCKNVTEHPADADWKALNKFARQKLPTLYLLLHNYNVTEKEFRICILIRLMFKPGDIATIMECRFPDVSLTRSRLLKKIYDIKGTANEFDKRIMLMY